MNKDTTHKKLNSEAVVAIGPAVLGFFLPFTKAIIEPRSGKSGIRLKMSVVLIVYKLSSEESVVSIDLIDRKTDMIIARPTAASAAATTITKNTAI